MSTDMELPSLKSLSPPQELQDPQAKVVEELDNRAAEIHFNEEVRALLEDEFDSPFEPGAQSLPSAS